MSIKAASLSDDYIVDLRSTSPVNVNPITGKVFFAALEKTYGANPVLETINWFMESDQNSSGMKKFNDRLEAALINDKCLSGYDQIYIADVVFRVSIGAFETA